MGNASCKSALQRTLQHQSEASYVSFGLLVFCFVITGIGFGARLVQWLRLSRDVRVDLWPKYGLFCGLSVTGCLFACFAWVAKALYFVEHARAVALQSAGENTSNISSAAAVESYMQYDRFLALYLVTYSAEFICLCASKVLVLHRMIVFVERSLQVASAARLHAAFHLTFAAVIAGSALNFIFNAVALSYSFKAIAGGNEYIAALGRNDTTGAQLLSETVLSPNSAISRTMRSRGQIVEVTVLCFIISAFTCVGILCGRRFRAVTVSSDAVRYLRRQVLTTVVFVFSTFTVRAALASVLAWIYYMGAPINTQCAPCDSCQSPQSIANLFMFANPEIYAAVVFVSSPLTLLVALWGMTSRRAQQIFGGGHQAARKKAELALTNSLMPRVRNLDGV